MGSGKVGREAGSWGPAMHLPGLRPGAQGVLLPSAGSVSLYVKSKRQDRARREEDANADAKTGSLDLGAHSSSFG